jgi:hypothetical protein
LKAESDLMNKKDVYEDVSFILFIMPFIAAGLYGLSLWISAGPSLVLPENVYLAVTKNPYIFLVGFASIMLGAVLEISNEDRSQRAARVVSLSKKMQTVAIVSLILSFLTAWYAKGFSSDITGAAIDMFLGRFNFIFPALLILFSFLVVPSLRVIKIDQRIIATILLLLVPVVEDEIGKRNITAGLASALILIVAGSYLFVRSWTRKERSISAART